MTNKILVFRTTSPNLCLSSEQNLLSIGSFNNKIHIYDVRTNEQVKTYKAHKRSVLSLGLENNKIVSAGEDNRIVLHDLRMDKLTAGLITLPQSGPQKTYPKSISYAKTSNSLPYFYIGDIRGNLYLINSHFKIEKIYPKIHSQAIQAVFHTICSVYSCSSDGKLIIHEPSEELGIVKQISMEKVELTKVEMFLEKENYIY
jgi:WD40 repeat protein